MLLLFIILAIIVIIVIPNIRVVPQAKAYVIERLGSYYTTWQNGLHIKIPFIDRISRQVNLKEIVKDFDPQPVITKDNVTMQIDTVVYFQITDPKLYTYGVDQPISAIENLTATTLRNIIGELELDQTLTSRDIINSKMRSILDEATDSWGIKVNRVELKNIFPPREIQEAMEKQMRAERERREAILKAEGEKRSSILIAEGEKESAILRAEAEKESRIKKAEGEAEAILKLKQAEAQGIELIKNAKADEKVIALKSLDALKTVADGNATKIIVPSDLQNIATLGTTVREMLKDNKYVIVRATMLIAACTFWCSCSSTDNSEGIPEKKDKSIVVFFESDSHCEVSGYPKLAGLRDAINQSDTAW